MLDQWPGDEVGGSGSQAPRRAAGQLESEVLAALWAASEPLSPAKVQALLEADLAYNTVHTILTRLHRKGQVRRVVVAGRRAYAPVRDAAQTAAQHMREALDGGPDRADTLASFVGTLSPQEAAALRAALRAAPRAAPARERER
jgi:predicted transcriptional regulator